MTSDNFRDFAGNQPVGSDDQDGDYSDASGAEEDALSILEQLAVDGLVLDDGDAVRHMDHHPEEPPKVLPVKIKKTGHCLHCPVQQHRRILKCFHGM